MNWFTEVLEMCARNVGRLDLIVIINNPLNRHACVSVLSDVV